ncbi:TlpA disulfide reductase family protein [Haliangium sp.]|uniref:TlpA disulfide reductase family protein n=1 Tax=Haliangium sp. TaxID=2663208 RepID=UPI003D0C2AFF
MRIVTLLTAVALAACSGAPAQPSDPGDPAGPEREPSTGPDPAPGPDDGAISLGTLDGAQTSFAAHRGPVTVVALWASYCAPCLRELHLIEALYQRYRDDDQVTVLLVSIDDFDQDNRDKIVKILSDRSMTVPTFIDREQQLIARVAPRDAKGKPYFAVPMIAVIDDHFRVRRELEFGHSLDDNAFIATVSPMVEAALRGDEVAPEEPYVPPLGSSFTKRTIKLTAQNIDDDQLEHYLANLRHQIAELYPDLHPHQLDDVMVQVEAKVRIGGTFTIEIPPPHQGPH